MKFGTTLVRSLAMIGTCAAAFVATSATAQVRIQNSFRADQQINVEAGPLASSPAQPGWLSAQWQIEPVDGTEFVRIRNAWKGTYLNNETGKLDSTAIQPGWLSAMWTLSKVGQGYRICNRYKATCLHTERGSLELGDAPTNWASAVWLLNGYVGAQVAAQAPAPQTTNQQIAGGFTQAGEGIRTGAVKLGNDIADGANTGVDTSNQALGSFWSLIRANGSADYRLTVDYCHSDLSDTNTGNAITVEFWSEIGGRAATMIGSDRRNGISKCSLFGAPASVDEAFTLLGAKSPVTHVVIKTNGDDAFYMDEVQLFEAGKQIMWEGRDNGSGWCLSTDPNDGGGEWSGKVSGLCVTNKRFNRQ